MANTAASTLVTRALDNVSRVATGTTRSGATWQSQGVDVLNAVMYQMSRKHDFRELKKRYTAPTIADQKTYSLPTDYKQINLIVLRDGNNSVKLTQMSPRLFNERIPYPENESTGVPSYYIPYGNEFDLFEIPDAVYTMYMRTVQWPTAITVATISDSISYTIDKDDVIVAGMTARLFDHIQMYEDGVAWKSEFLRLFAEAESIDTQQNDYDPKGLGFGSAAILPGEYWNRTDVWRIP